MRVKKKEFGKFYHTNCYLVDDRFIIDPGIDATSWVLKNINNPKAIILTHGHFDHTWSVNELQKILKIPVYIHKDDVFMAKEDVLNAGINPFDVDFEVVEGEYEIDNTKFLFRHFPGHTPGSMTIEVGDFMFSGDFIFKRSIGRSDFPYSDVKQMKNSLKRFLKINYDKIILPGHGTKTTIKDEQQIIKNYWLEVL